MKKTFALILLCLAPLGIWKIIGFFNAKPAPVTAQPTYHIFIDGADWTAYSVQVSGPVLTFKNTNGTSVITSRPFIVFCP